MKITTNRLILREFEAGDWQAVLAYQSDSRYLRYYPWEGRTEADAHEFVGMFLSQQAEKPRRKFQFAVTHRDDNRLIGNCGLRLSSVEPSEADIGYELNPQFWGQGYATEAAQEMLRLGFAGFGMRRMTANCLAENIASARVLERIGMQCVACLRQTEFFKGRWWNGLRYAIDDYEWWRL